MKLETKMMIIYIVVGIIAGYLSQQGRILYEANGVYIAIILALVLLVITNEINKKIFKINKEFKWFMSNGGWIYLFVWFISWVVFFNPPFSPL